MFYVLFRRIEQFQQRSTKEHHLGSYIQELSKLEKKLLETQDVFNVRGKRGRRVPIIIPCDMPQLMNLLVNEDVRKRVGVEKSQYIFADLKHPGE